MHNSLRRPLLWLFGLGTLLLITLLFLFFQHQVHAAQSVNSQSIKISTSQELQDVMNNKYPLNNSFVLTDDIDLSNISAKPIGSESNPFTGTFNGNGHTISNISLTLSQNTTGAGFFGNIAASGVVKNLTLNGINITIQAPANIESVGGLVGINQGTITSSATNNVQITAADNNGVASLIGGFAGYNKDSGNINNCSSDAKIKVTTSSSLGGFVGMNGMQAQIGQCYSLGSIEQSNLLQWVGGFAGDNIHQISNCYSQTSVTVNNPLDKQNLTVGGFVGLNDHGATINSSYSAGAVSSPKPTKNNNGKFAGVGGFAGYDMDNGAGITKSYWDTTKCDQANGIGNVINPGGVIGANTPTMRQASTYANWDFDNIWNIQANDYPHLQWQLPLHGTLLNTTSQNIVKLLVTHDSSAVIYTTTTDNNGNFTFPKVPVNQQDLVLLYINNTALGNAVTVGNSSIRSINLNIQPNTLTVYSQPNQKIDNTTLQNLSSLAPTADKSDILFIPINTDIYFPQGLTIEPNTNVSATNTNVTFNGVLGKDKEQDYAAVKKYVHLNNTSSAIGNYIFNDFNLLSSPPYISGTIQNAPLGTTIDLALNGNYIDSTTTTDNQGSYEFNISPTKIQPGDLILIYRPTTNTADQTNAIAIVPSSTSFSNFNFTAGKVTIYADDATAIDNNTLTQTINTKTAPYLLYNNKLDPNKYHFAGPLVVHASPKGTVTLTGDILGAISGPFASAAIINQSSFKAPYPTTYTFNGFNLFLGNCIAGNLHGAASAKIGFIINGKQLTNETTANNGTYQYCLAPDDPVTKIKKDDTIVAYIDDGNISGATIRQATSDGNASDTDIYTNTLTVTAAQAITGIKFFRDAAGTPTPSSNLLFSIIDNNLHIGDNNTSYKLYLKDINNDMAYVSIPITALPHTVINQDHGEDVVLKDVNKNYTPKASLQWINGNDLSK